MTVPVQNIAPGALESAWREELQRLADRQAIAKIWSKQASLWKSDAAHARVILNRLGWIPVVEAMRPEVDVLHRFARSVREAGMRHVVLLGMGGSSLAPEVFSLLFPPADLSFHVLDSTDPASLLAVESAVDLKHTLFIVASKSGRTIETLSQFHYFRTRLEAAGVASPGPHFTAITDASSYLERLAIEYKFRRAFLNPADIGGRYSALSYFGLVPAAVCGVPVAVVLNSAVQMRDACAPQAPAKLNPALALGALMGVAAQQGADRLFLLATPSLVPLANWIEQLVAESTGKEGTGVIPVAGEVPGAPEAFDRGVIVLLALEGEERREQEAFAAVMSKRGAPVVRIVLTRREELGAAFFHWELATAVAGAVLGINPFDEPNVQEAKDITARLLDTLEKTGKMAEGVRVAASDGLEVFAPSAQAGRLPKEDPARVLQVVLNELAGEDDYVALLAFLDRSPRNVERVEALRQLVRDSTRRATLAGFGPRYLHSIGQLYKGGPPSGVFLEITAADAEDVPVPGAQYTFGQLKMAQALGDMEALAAHGKTVVRVHFTQGAEAGLHELHTVLEKALASKGAARAD